MVHLLHVHKSTNVPVLNNSTKLKCILFALTYMTYIKFRPLCTKIRLDYPTVRKREMSNNSVCTICTVYKSKSKKVVFPSCAVTFCRFCRFFEFLIIYAYKVECE